MHYFGRGCAVLACLLALLPLASSAAPEGSGMPLFEDRTSSGKSVPVARNVQQAEYVTVYSISLSGVTAGQLVHLTGQASFSNKLAYNVGLGTVLLRVHPDESTKQVVPYAMENVTPEIHHTIRTFSAYDVPPLDNPVYVFKAYAVATRARKVDSLPIHRGFLQAVTFPQPSAQK